MSSLVKEDLAKRLFGPRRQRLHEFIEVEGAGAQRYYLCAAVTKSKEVEICMVKHWRVDREEKYEVVEKWFLKDLEMIDGKEADTDNPYFDMHFHKVYNMEAYSCASKYTFARTLSKLNATYLKKDFKIVNFDDTYLNDDSIWSSSNRDFVVVMKKTGIAVSQVISREKKIHGSLKMKKSDHKQTEIHAHIRGRKRIEAVIKDSQYRKIKRPF